MMEIKRRSFVIGLGTVLGLGSKVVKAVVDVPPSHVFTGPALPSAQNVCLDFEALDTTQSVTTWMLPPSHEVEKNYLTEQLAWRMQDDEK
jgi:hypothetical protein